MGITSERLEVMEVARLRVIMRVVEDTIDEEWTDDEGPLIKVEVP